MGCSFYYITLFGSDKDIKHIHLFNASINKLFEQVHDCNGKFNRISDPDQMNTWMRECFIKK